MQALLGGSPEEVNVAPLRESSEEIEIDSSEGVS